MSAQHFLNIDELLDLIMDELPDGPYAKDRADDPNPDNRSNSSSELRAHAQIFANLYDNLDQISEDEFISTVTPDGLTFWEKDLFMTAQDSSQSYQTRQQNLLAKWRSRGGINIVVISNIIHGILDPKGLAFQILPYCGQSNGTIPGAWLFGISQLGFGTWLAELDPLRGAGRDPGITPLDCNLDYAAAGLTLAQLQAIQATAYTYEVQIFGNADAMTLALLDDALTKAEPARSTHIITNNVTPP